MGVKYPEMRLNLWAAARDLGDPEFQQAVWAQAKAPTPGKRFPFHEAIAYVLDDLDVPSPQSLIGDVLISSSELALLSRLSALLSVVLSRVGGTAAYGEVAQDAAWHEVISAARALRDAIERGDRLQDGREG